MSSIANQLIYKTTDYESILTLGGNEILLSEIKFISINRLLLKVYTLKIKYKALINYF